MRLALAFLTASACFAQAVPSNVHLDPLGLNSTAARFVFDSNVAFSDQRYQWALAPTSCSSGAGGAGVTTSPGLGIASGTYLVNRTQIVTGFPASSSINYCPQLFSMGAWSTGVEFNFTSPANPVSSTPLAPDAVNTTFPVPSGTPYTIPVGDCANVTTGLAARIAIAVPGDTITIPAGTVCSGLYTIPRTSTAKAFSSSSVRTSDSHVTINSHGFGTVGTEVEVRVFSNQDVDGVCMPGAEFHMMYNRCDQDSQGGWQAGYRYLAYIVDANTVELRKMDHSIASPGELNFTVNTSTENITMVANETFYLGLPFGVSTLATTVPVNTVIQFKNVGGALPTSTPQIVVDTDYYTKTVCTGLDSAFCTTQISLISGGAAIDFTGTGTGTHYIVTQGTPSTDKFYMAPAPNPTGQYVTVIGGGTLPPIDTRVMPENDAQLGIIEKTLPYPSTDGNTPMFNILPGAFNWHFRGLLMRAATSTDYTVTIDPRGFGNFISSHSGPENIIFDQVHQKCNPYPQRCGGASGYVTDFNGRNVGVINSWIDDQNSWHPVLTGLTPTVTSTAIGRLSQGTAKTGPSIFQVTTSGIVEFTISNGAGVSGSIMQYVAMNGTITVLAPNTVVGSITACPGATCAWVNTATPAYPTVVLSSSGGTRKASCPLATWTLTGGNLTAVSNQQAVCTTIDGWNGTNEGTQSQNGGAGPGPFIWSNNYYEGTGIGMHYSDDSRLEKHSYTATKNHWVSLPQYCLENAASNGMRYWNRNQLEWKGGARILVEGNRFMGNCADRSPSSVSLIFTPRNNSGYTTDMAVRNNYFASGSGGTTGCAVQSTPVLGRPCARQEFSNNLFTMTGYGYSAGSGTPGTGWAMFNFSFGAGILINKNTQWNATGSVASSLHWDGPPTGLVTITSNLFSTNGGTGSTIGQFFRGSGWGCIGGPDGYAALTCSTVSAVFSGNAALPGHSVNYSSPTPSGNVSRSAVCTAWNGTYTTNCGGSFAGSLFFNQTTGAANYAAAGYVSTSLNDFRLDPSSPLIGAGASGEDIGVDFEALMDASGIVRDIVITPASNSVTVNWTAPDAKDCFVGISSDGGATWTYTTDTGSAGARSITLGSLTPLTGYTLRVLDYYDQTAALGFYGGMVTTQAFTTVAPSASGPGSFRGVGMRGGVR